MTEKRLASVCGCRGIRMYAGLIVSVGLALWLMLGAVGAQQQSAGIFMGQVAQSRKADLEAQSRINEALKAFDELLAVTKSAAARNSHWRVRLESWDNALEAWRKASAALPTPVRRLKRCAVPLATARGMIERADDLFNQGRNISDPFRAVQLLERHKRLLKQAEGPLKRAERCYLAVRNGYLKGRKVVDHSQVKVFSRLWSVTKATR